MASAQGNKISELDQQFDFNANDLSKQFEQLLSTRRLNELEEQVRGPRTGTSTPQRNPTQSQFETSPYPQRPVRPQPLSGYRSTPLVPCAPQDASSLKFRNMLLTLSVTPTKYENPGLLDEALTYVPFDRIYAEAEEEHNVMKGIAASVGRKEEWGYQDCVMRSLLK